MAESFQAIVDRFGRHAAEALELDLDTEQGRLRWLVVAALASERSGEAGAWEAFRALRAAGLEEPATLARSVPERVAAVLEAAGRPRPERAAALLLRLGSALAERHGGSLERLRGEAGDLGALGEALVRLAPGFGPAAALRFLRPLRSRWPAAAEVPLDPDARAAAIHLSWIPPGADGEGEPSALAAALATEPDAPTLWDAEAALARLGRAACRRERPDRCPLAERCPRR